MYIYQLYVCKGLLWQNNVYYFDQTPDKTLSVHRQYVSIICCNSSLRSLSQSPESSLVHLFQKQLILIVLQAGRGKDGAESGDVEDYPLFSLAEAIYMSWFTFELLIRLVS